jgi:hypothetical protein
MHVCVIATGSGRRLEGSLSLIANKVRVIELSGVEREREKRRVLHRQLKERRLNQEARRANTQMSRTFDCAADQLTQLTKAVKSKRFLSLFCLV